MGKVIRLEDAKLALEQSVEELRPSLVSVIQSIAENWHETNLFIDNLVGTNPLAVPGTPEWRSWRYYGPHNSANFAVRMVTWPKLPRHYWELHSKSAPQKILQISPKQSLSQLFEANLEELALSQTHPRQWQSVRIRRRL